MKKTISILCLLCISCAASWSVTPKSTPKKQGAVSKVKDAATRGFGWGLGREAAKSTVNGVKKVANSPKTKEAILKTKEKSKELIDKVKK